MKSFPVYTSLTALLIALIFIVVIISSSNDAIPKNHQQSIPLSPSISITLTPSVMPSISSTVTLTPVHHLYPSQADCEHATNTQCVYIHIDCFRAGPGCGETGWQKK